MILVALLAVGVLLAGVAVFLVLRDVGGDDDRGGGPVDLREPMTLQLVQKASPPPCASGALPDENGSSCLTLAPERMIVERVEYIEVKPPSPRTGTGWTVRMRLTPSDGEDFGRLTGRAAERPGTSDARRIAMIVGGAVVSAPTVSEPVTGGEVMIHGSFSRPEAENLVRRMTGR
ncbi:MAG TPA: hypothetical protein VIL71_06235 [Spirillospora sp.]